MRDIIENGPQGPDDPDAWRDEVDDQEDNPTGSCERCGANICADDNGEYCDQCLWWITISGV